MTPRVTSRGARRGSACLRREDAVPAELRLGSANRECAPQVAVNQTCSISLPWRSRAPSGTTRRDAGFAASLPRRADEVRVPARDRPAGGRSTLAAPYAEHDADDHERAPRHVRVDQRLRATGVEQLSVACDRPARRGSSRRCRSRGSGRARHVSGRVAAASVGHGRTARGVCASRRLAAVRSLVVARAGAGYCWRWSIRPRRASAGSRSRPGRSEQRIPEGSAAGAVACAPASRPGRTAGVSPRHTNVSAARSSASHGRTGASGQRTGN